MNGFLLGLLLTSIMSIAVVIYPTIKEILPSIFNQSSTSIPTTIPTSIPSSIPIYNTTDNEVYSTSTNTPTTIIPSTTTPSTTTPIDNQEEKMDNSTKKNSTNCITDKEIEEIEYYPQCDSSHTSIVDALKSIGVEDTSFSFRKAIAELNGISNYSVETSGTNNLILLSLLKEGKLIKSKTIKVIKVETNCDTEEKSDTNESTIATTIINMKNLKELVIGLLKCEEGNNKGHPCTPYNDSLGYATIGIGKLCNGKTFMKTIEQINKECADLAAKCTDDSVPEKWLSDDIDKFISCIETTSNIKVAYDKASDKRKAILISMAYQLGCDGLSKFVKTLNLMAEEKWDEAAIEMLDSKWAKQDSKQRAWRHSNVTKYDDCLDFCSLYGWNN